MRNMPKPTNRDPCRSYLDKACRFLSRIEDGILVGLLMLMIITAFTQIFLRNLFEFGIVWGDVMVRILVLWIGLVGAMVASRQNNHISIDLITRYLPKRPKNIVNSLTQLFASLVCGIAAYHSALFVKMEFEYGGTAFAKVPTWLCEAIIPVAFIVIALRYCILFMTNLSKAIKPSS
jgi:TRAP-type C4-dicarboxylate transport system permease small subunit